MLSPTNVKVVVPAIATPLRAKIAASDKVVNVVIQNPDGQQALFSEGYTYINNVTPIITGIAPIQGSVAGGTSVTINGSNLTGTTGVTFGGSVTLTGGYTYVALTVGDAYGGGVIYRIVGSTAYIISPSDVSAPDSWGPPSTVRALTI